MSVQIQATSVKTENFEQAENEDTVVITLNNGNEWRVQRLNGQFNQMMGCELNKNGEQNPNFDEEAELVVSLANNA